VPGTRTRMKIAAPGSRGAIRIPWQSEHDALDDPAIAPLTADPATLDNSAHTGTAHGFGFADRMVDYPRVTLHSWQTRHIFRPYTSPAPEAAASPASSPLSAVTV